MKIGHKLVLGSLVLSSLVCAVGFYAVVVSRRVLQESIEDTSSELAAELMQDVDRTIYDHAKYWRIFATSGMLRQAVRTSNEQFERLPDIRAYVDRKDSQWRAAPEGKLNAEMKDLIGNETSEELRRRQEAVQRYEGCPVYGEVFVTNRYGANVAQTSRTSDYRQDDEPWWQRTMKDGLYIGDVSYDESADVFSMDVCVRVDDDAGNPLGVIKTVLNIQSLASVLRNRASVSHSKAAQQGHLFLLTAGRGIIFSSKDSEIGVQLDSQYDYDFGDSSAGQNRIFERWDKEDGRILAACVFSEGHKDYVGHNWSLVVENRAEKILAPVTALRNTILWMSVAIAVAAFAVAVVFSFSLSRRIRTLRGVALEVGQGHLTVRANDRSSDEIGELTQSINEMANNQQEVARRANTMAEGDYSADIAPRSDSDELADSINRMAASLREVVRQANTIAEGDYSAKIVPRGDKDELGTALNKMTENLRLVSAQNETDRWLKTGQAELSDTMRGEQDLPTLSKNVITYLAKYLGARLGVMYLNDGNGTLRLAGSYAFSQRKRLVNAIRPGEGLVGQAALDKESIAISDVPEDYITINSGLGESVPRSLLATPVILDGQVKGVLELGAFKPFTETQIELLKLVAENIAIAINSAQDRDKMSELLQQSRRQAEELQAQQEELRASNEELEEHTEALRRSEEKLKVQSEELQASNEELEEKSQYLSQQKADIEKKNRELEITGREVEEKARELEMASKYKSEFLANMSHELRTPLNSLLILAKSLANNEEGNLTDEQVESAMVINEGGRELLNLINEILDLSKVEAGRLDVHLENVSIASITRRLQTQFNPVAAEKGLQFRIETDDRLPETLRTDGQRVEQVLKNLLSNAMKFTKEGSVTLRMHRPKENVRFRNTGLTAANAVAMSVIDTGIGIPEDRQRAIFEAFQQADGSTSRKYGGTGLGLAISRELATLLGGEVHIRSRAGEGSIFTLYLPLEHHGSADRGSADRGSADRGSADRGSADKNNLPEPATTTLAACPHIDAGSADGIGPLPAPSIAEFLGDDRHQIGDGDKTLLIIEDDLRFAKILVDLSRKRGYKCLVAGDGSSGLQMAFKHTPNGVILDLGLPDIDGLNVLDQLKHNLQTRHVPVHVISARDESTPSLRKGAIGHMAKPAGLENLRNVFSKIEDTLQAHARAILIVEDDETLRRSLVTLIDNKGIEITAVGCGEEACKKMSAFKFDGIILDLGLPDMTGLELLKRLRDLKGGELPPVIVYTGRHLTRKEHAELSKYADSIVLKEADSEQRVLDEVLLFLHSVESSLPADQQKVIRMLHDPDQVFKDRKVLLVDDDMRNTFALSKVLQKSGLSVVMADNGKLALEKLETEEDIELVVMDIMMPVMDGYEATRAIRSQPRFEKLPIIALTAKAMPEDRAKCLEAGANDYLTKPIDVEKLLSLMRVWLFKQELFAV